jgi:type IV secretory pathway VirB9-like protein
MRNALLAGAALCALTTPAYATQDPLPSRDDPRVGSFTYVETDVFRIWSAPEASFIIKLAEGEIADAVTGADVCPEVKAGEKPPTNCGIIALPRYNWVHLKFQHCLIPEMLLVVGKTANGKMRMYNFEVHTEPLVCDTAAPPAKPKPSIDVRLISTATAAEIPEGSSNLTWVKGNALTRNAEKPIFYSVAFRYPGDEAEKRRESAKERREREKKEQVDYLLTREADALTEDPWRGTGNVDYRWRGSSDILPYIVRDNGRSTGMKFAGQHAPVLYQVIAPDNYQCRDEDPAPAEERQAQYAPRARGDALIIAGTAKVWRLRDSDGKVADICNLNYTPYLPASPTGTISDRVQRVVK